ncbi:MAG: hypothetical protein CL624_09515 [Arcobacter sp.]|nr:hypothetical protein [Arcobacter sp.]|tara:strand:- start:22658 stop:22840 length:183 start_codon:yes stop_codon:yes gene_type:complete
MGTLFHLSILTIFITAFIKQKTYMMIISTVIGSIGILNLILNYGLKVPSGFLVNTLLVWV